MALRLAPTNAEIHYNLGKGLRDHGRFEGAIASFKTAVTHRPNFAAAWHELGNLLADQGNLADASIALARAAPHIPDAFIELIWTRRRMCDWNGYAEAEMQARRLNGTQVFALMNLQSTVAEQRNGPGARRSGSASRSRRGFRRPSLGDATACVSVMCRPISEPTQARSSSPV
jgi:Tfp pilus assembly protein PilF